jgi:hypothetical protein
VRSLPSLRRGTSRRFSAAEEIREELEQLAFERRSAAFVGVGGGDKEAADQAGQLATAISAKETELATAELAVEDLSPLFTNGQGREELMFLLAAHVRKSCEQLSIPADPRLAEVETVGEKALAKRDEIAAAETEEELEAVTWEEAS